MAKPESWPSMLAHAVHRHLLGLLIASYLIAAFLPGPGLWLRSLSPGTLAIHGEKLHLSLPALMLSLLLFNAGLGVTPSHLRGVLGRPAILLAGLAANLAVPIGFLLGTCWLLGIFWHNPHEVQCILVGLALVAAMPVAGSSTAWSQNADGNLALSLGLILGSTLLSPLTTPLVLHAASLLASGDYADRLQELSGQGTGLFLLVWVLLPSLLGMLCRQLLGEERTKTLLPGVKLANILDLLLLCYSNAAVSLPEAVANPDPDFVVAMLLIVAALCVLGFGVGWLLGRFLEGDIGQRNALMFGLGMNNNGTGLVLAATALSGYPRVMQPIILYNLVQHLVAATVSSILTRQPVAEPIPEPDRMRSLYTDPWFTFRFADDRIIPRFHLEGVPAGQQVSVFSLDSGTGERRSLLAQATVGEGGWVELGTPIIVRAGEVFIAVPG